PSLTVTGLRLVGTTDHAIGLPVLRALSLCTCPRHYPGAATEAVLRSCSSIVSAFPVRVDGSARASSFSRLARRSLALRPAHSRCRDTLIRRLQPLRYLRDSSVASWLEQLPGGARTHWKAPPFHGAHPNRTFTASSFPWPQPRSRGKPHLRRHTGTRRDERQRLQIYDTIQLLPCHCKKEIRMIHVIAT